MQTPRQQNKGFFGDLLGSVLQPAGALAGGALSAFGVPTPIGTAAGGFLGGKLGDLARRLPFKKGGVVPKKNKKMKKGSTQAKAFMAKLRSMRKK